MARKAVLVAAWSVLAVLLLSKSAFAGSLSYTAPVDPVDESFTLSPADSVALYRRIKVPTETLTTSKFKMNSKRILSSDGAFHIQCLQAVGVAPMVGTSCVIELKNALSVLNVSQIRKGSLDGSFLFTLQKKADVDFIVNNVIYTAGPFSTMETVAVTNPRNEIVHVPLFELDCRPEWAFGIASCDGYLLRRPKSQVQNF